MKNLYYILSIVSSVIILTSCNDPEATECIYQDKRLCDPNFDNSIYEGVIDFDQTKLDAYQQKTILEEFTGFKCTNCPVATATAKNLAEDYPGRLHLVSIHCTEEFASPDTDDPNEPFHMDFRTVEGKIYHEYFDPPGLPDGIINRLGTENTSTIPYPLWSDKLEQLMAENDPDCYLEILDVSFFDDSSMVEVNAIAKPINVLNDGINLNVAVIESGIHEAQKTTGNQILYDYVHDHVFRTASHGAWGIKAFDGDLDVEAEKILQFKFRIPINDEWMLENLDFVLYASKESNREVIQSEIYHLE